MSGGVDLRVDASGFINAAKTFESAGKNAPAAIRRAVNRTGDMAKTQVKRVLVIQTGLKAKVIDKALKSTPASGGSLSYVIESRGGDVRVQYFGAKESGSGVVAHPWNSSRMYAGGFMKQGFTRRVAFTKPGMAGHVFKRSGAGRLPIGQLKSGLYIPKEMVSGASKAAFESTVASVLPRRLDHELGAIFSGAVKG